MAYMHDGNCQIHAGGPCDCRPRNPKGGVSEVEALAVLFAEAFHDEPTPGHSPDADHCWQCGIAKHAVLASDWLAAHVRRKQAEALREAADDWLGSVTLTHALEAVLTEHITIAEPEGPDGPYIWCACGWRSDDIGRDNPGVGVITHLLNVLHAATVEPIRTRLRDRADRIEGYRETGLSNGLH